MNLQNILEQASKLKIAVVGDLIEDIYIIGDVKRISPEAPVQIVSVTEHRTNWGGAGNVVENLKGLGVEVSFFFNEVDVPKKTRIMSGNHHLLRIDEERDPILQRWDDIDICLGYGIENQKYNCVVVSDYSKGMISTDVAANLITLCMENKIPVVVDTKNQHHLFDNVHLLKCNYAEWERYKDKINAHDGVWQYMYQNQIDNLVVTHGQHGMAYHGFDSERDELTGYLPAHPVAIADTCGAGDTVTAVLAVMTALGEPIDKSCELANIAASEVCRWPGVKAINKEDLMKRYKEVHGI